MDLDLTEKETPEPGPDTEADVVDPSSVLNVPFDIHAVPRKKCGEYVPGDRHSQNVAV